MKIDQGTIPTPSINKTHSRRLLQLFTALCLACLALVLTPGAAGAQTSASIQASPNPVQAGGLVRVTGSGFQPAEQVSIEFAGSTVAVTIADNAGQFSTSGMVDSSVPAGGHPMDANGDMGSWATIDLTIAVPVPTTAAPAPATPQATPAAAAPGVSFNGPVPAGGSTVVTGTGFQPGEQVTISFGGSTVGTTVAGAAGDWSTSIQISVSMPVGAHPLDIMGNLGSIVDTSLEVSAAIPAPTTTPATTQPPSTTQAPTTTQAPVAAQTPPNTQSAVTNQATPQATAPQSSGNSTTGPVTSSQPAPQGIDDSTQISKLKPAQGDTSQGAAVITNGAVDQQSSPAIDTSVSMATPQAEAANGVSTGRLILVVIFALTLSAAAVTAVMVVRERS
jgi:hypothetical protein